MMTGWFAKRTPGMSTRTLIAIAALGLLLVAVAPVALVVAVIMMILGHVVGGLALFGSVLAAAAIALTVAGMTGKRRLRRLLSGGGVFLPGGGIRLDGTSAGPPDEAPEPPGTDYRNVVRLDHDDYTEVP